MQKGKNMVKVALVMGSKSDWKTMQACAELLEKLDIKFQQQVVSAHRTPKKMLEFAETAQAMGYEIIIAAAGGAAHLPGMIAAMTAVPVIGVPIQSSVLNGIDSLLSIVQMPAGVPVATMSIGTAGAKNAALYCAAILASHDLKIKQNLLEFRQKQTQNVLDNPNPADE